jgi:hypothetical protein
MADEEDRWFKALAGHSEGADRSELSAQAAALRAAIRARAVRDAGDVRGIDPGREAELVARARTAGLLPRRQRRRWVALAAALACVAVGVSLQLRNPSSTVVRGDASAVVHLRSHDPLRLKHDLLRELNAVGIAATGYATPGRQGIDAEVPAPLPDPVRKVLERHAIPVPRGTVLQIEIESDSGP